MIFIHEIKKRAKAILIILSIWSMVIVLYLFYNGFSKKKEYLKASKEISLFHGFIPAPRGNIYDADNVCLAWNVPRIKLIISEDVFKSNLNKLKNIDTNHSFSIKETEHSIVLHGISKEKVKLLFKQLPFLVDCVNLEIEYKRVYIKNKELKEILGSVRDYDNNLVGETGIEKEYNKYLTGINGEYQVIKNKEDNWVLGTFKVIKKMRPGKNLYLDEDTLDLEKKN